MNIIYDHQSDINEQLSVVGGKAANLFRLRQAGFNVPRFLVIPHEEMSAVFASTVPAGESLDMVPDSLYQKVSDYFSKNTLFAVRSSALAEDGLEHSFAGQFETLLNVPLEELQEAITQVWQSAFAERVESYKKQQGINELSGMGILIQEMIPAEVSGVAFGLNPVSGNQDEIVINSVFGLGEGLVSGDINADLFIVKDQDVASKPGKKNHRYLLDAARSSGVTQEPLPEHLQEAPSLNSEQIKEVASLVRQANDAFGHPQDIEFAIANDTVYLLQARPVTTKVSAEKRGEYILWDNSNIVESYPGVTTPLTFSFISQSYEQAYKLFCGYLGVAQKVIMENEQVFKNTLGLINGRVYYNLKTWYHMLAMVPGYSINARYMETMMGVKERFDIPEKYLLSRSKAWWSILKMAVGMIRRMFALPAKRKEFMALLESTITSYKSIDYSTKNANELMQLYLEFESRLLNEWKAPLLNDFFAMIWFGMLQKHATQYIKSDNPNIHNDLLCGSSDIISTQPIHRTIEIATFINEHPRLRALFTEKDTATIWSDLAKASSPEESQLKEKIEKYIYDFGERCIGELKLETVSYEQDPLKFIKILKSYVEQGITARTTSNDVEKNLREAAETELQEKLQRRPLKKAWLRFVLRQTRSVVSGRENLRYERTRAFGIVRKIFSQLGITFHEEDILSDPRDIFYLSKEEIFAYIEGRSVTTNLKGLAQFRKAEFEAFKEMPPPAERFPTYGAVYSKNDFYDNSRQEASGNGDLKGIGCCPGKVRAKVRYVKDPEEVESLNGDILITSSTDPGWVTLFPSASGIIVERGSLLSHSAIVAREMGIPCIVSVSGLLKTLQTGDEVEMDGSSGDIFIQIANESQ